jgi:uncharacterized membrane protein (DUF2068 family)
MTDSPSQPFSKPRHRDRGLILIAAFKLLQALLFIAIGVGVLRLLHKDVSDVLERLAYHLRFNPESHFVNFILVKSTLINDRMLRQIGEVVFIYAGLDLIEGIGLYLEKVWAEYLTLAIIAYFLPFELIEVFHRLTWIRVGLLAANTLVLFYLVYMVVEHGRHRRTKRSTTG